jgi:hypothetical protein
MHEACVMMPRKWEAHQEYENMSRSKHSVCSIKKINVYRHFFLRFGSGWREYSFYHFSLFYSNRRGGTSLGSTTFQIYSKPGALPFCTFSLSFSGVTKRLRLTILISEFSTRTESTSLFKYLAMKTGETILNWGKE